MWSVGATNPYAAISLRLAWAKWHFWTFTLFLFACFFFLTGNVLYMWYTPRKHVWCNFDGWVQNLEISITFMLAFYLLLTTEVECLRICKHGNNEWVASNRILAFAHRFLRSPRGKHSNSLWRNVWRKVVWTSKISDFGERLLIFRSSFIIHG